MIDTFKSINEPNTVSNPSDTPVSINEPPAHLLQAAKPASEQAEKPPPEPAPAQAETSKPAVPEVTGTMATSEPSDDFSKPKRKK